MKDAMSLWRLLYGFCRLSKRALRGALAKLHKVAAGAEVRPPRPTRPSQIQITKKSLRRFSRFSLSTPCFPSSKREEGPQCYQPASPTFYPRVVCFQMASRLQPKTPLRSEKDNPILLEQKKE